MDSAQVQGVLEALFGTISILQASKFSQVAAAVLAIYDHALTLDEEIRLVWNKPFSLVSLLYYINRYVGDILVILDAILYVNTFFSVDLCRDFLQISIWGPFITVWATQLIMQLRLYAMFGKSKKLLAFILPLLIAEIGGIVAVLILYVRTMAYTNSPLPPEISLLLPTLNLRMCAATSDERLLTAVYVPLFGYEAVMFMLALVALVRKYGAGRRQGFERGARLNATVNLLMQSSIAYFFVYFVACAVAVGMYLGLPFTYAEVLNSFLTVASIILGSRLVLSFRAYNYRPQTLDSFPASDLPPPSATYGSRRPPSHNQWASSPAGVARKGSDPYASTFSPATSKSTMPYWNSWDAGEHGNGSYLELDDVVSPVSENSQLGVAV
ncbi:hypothetical protein CONPUDRAFT_83887 [Coniophora puteana RWD-64-598 SS2]|uniref:DUF6533 domain-containing protein n=1 Tax=Coniophora puteana (strain RWD-64-598) TaxID=741705 RepID=A0A5M3MH11_CONPW|nr:uncharacterized protein CONPUDRAFT_83887 [Coniophora puteana RWD-64-598 SS2]EIW78512.1 hypothetical protein CONPUDRAFT_83887 [Coniophora puteana RWD-64-598 SS2]